MDTRDRMTSAVARAIVAAALVSGSVMAAEPVSARERVVLTTAQGAVVLEVARTPSERHLGLMNRVAVPSGTGMLFVYSAPRRVGMWMANTLVPLDMVFMREGRVVRVVRGAQPCTQQPCPVLWSGSVVDQVIELRSGQAASLGIDVGDRISIDV